MLSAFRLYSEIVRQPWAIDPWAGLGYLPAIEALERAHEFETLRAAVEQAHPKAGMLADLERGPQKPALRADGVQLIELVGPVMKSDFCGSPGSATIAGWLGEAAADPAVKAVLLRVDSPGGTVSGTPALSDAVRSAAEKKPVLALIDGLGASAAYWAASAGTEVYAASPESLIGSIGVMVSYTDLREYYAKEGIKKVDVYADTSTEKNQEFRAALEGNFGPLKTNLLNPMDALFMDAVKAARPGVSEKALKGGTYLAGAAQTHGLIDGVASFDAAVARALELAASPTTQPKQMAKKLMAVGAFTALILNAVNAGEEMTEEKAQEIADQANALQTQLDTVQASVKTLTGEKTTLTGKVTDLEGQVTSLTASRDSEKARADKAEGDLKARTDAAAKVEKPVADASKEQPTTDAQTEQWTDYKD